MQVEGVSHTSSAETALAELSDEINMWVHTSAVLCIQNVTTKIDVGDIGVYLHFPVSLLFPVTTLYYIANVASDVRITPKFIEYSLSPTVFSKLPSPRKPETLKLVDSSFSSINEDSNVGIQFILE